MLCFSLSILVTLIAIHAVVHIAAHALMPGVSLRFGVAVGAREHRIVIRIRMARAAHTVGIAVVQREPGVVEFSICPLDCIVAGCTRGREVRGNMVRIVRVLVIGFMTAIAVGR